MFSEFSKYLCFVFCSGQPALKLTHQDSSVPIFPVINLKIALLILCHMNPQGYVCNLSEEQKVPIISMPVLLMDTGIQLFVLYKSMLSIYGPICTLCFIFFLQTLSQGPHFIIVVVIVVLDIYGDVEGISLLYLCHYSFQGSQPGSFNITRQMLEDQMLYLCCQKHVQKGLLPEAALIWITITSPPENGKAQP